MLLAYRPRHPDGQRFFDHMAEDFVCETLPRPDAEDMANISVYCFRRRLKGTNTS